MNAKKKILAVGTLKYQLDQGLAERSCFSIFHALSNEEAMALHAADHADLILTRLDGAGLTGEDLCARIRRDPALKDVSVVLVCRDDPADMERVNRCGANGYITKPVTNESIADKISALMNIRKRQAFRVILHVTVNGRLGPRSFVCKSVNVSATGILIEARESLRAGEHVGCSFFLPGLKQVLAEGEVMRAIDRGGGLFEYGIRFTDIKQDCAAAIEAFVRSRVG